MRPDTTDKVLWQVKSASKERGKDVASTTRPRPFFLVVALVAMVCAGMAHAATLSGAVTYADGTPAWFGISVRDQNDTCHFPPYHVPVLREGIDQKFWFAFGSYSLSVEPGAYTLKLVPGRAWSQVEKQVTVAGDGAVADIVLERTAGVSTPTRVRIAIKEDGAGQACRLTVTYKNEKNESVLLTPFGVLGRNWRQTQHWFHVKGGCEIEVPENVTGPIAIHAVRGTEYEFFDTTIAPKAGTVTDVVVELQRWIDLAEEGWYSGDVHTHILGANGPPNNRTPIARFPQHAFEMMKAEDFKVGAWLLCPLDSDVNPDRGLYSQGPYRIKFDQEPRNSTYGHMDALLLKRAVQQYNAGREFSKLDYPSNLPLIKQLREAGGVVGYAHPIAGKREILLNLPCLGEASGINNTAICRGLPSDAVLGPVDFLEIYSWSASEDANEELWYRLMNCGFSIMPAAGTDAFNGSHAMSGPPAGLRMYVRVDGELTYEKWVAALAQGRSFMTSGPALLLKVNGQDTGSSVMLDKSDSALTANIRLRSNLPVDVVEVLVGGQVVKTFEVNGQWRDFRAECPIATTKSSYVTARAKAAERNPALIEEEVRALTGPVFLQIPGQPRRSAEDAAYFLRWLDEFEALLKTEAVFEDDAQKTEVIGELHQARKFYEKMREQG